MIDLPTPAGSCQYLRPCLDDVTFAMVRALQDTNSIETLLHL